MWRPLSTIFSQVIQVIYTTLKSPFFIFLYSFVCINFKATSCSVTFFLSFTHTILFNSSVCCLLDFCLFCFYVMPLGSVSDPYWTQYGTALDPAFEVNMDPDPADPSSDPGFFMTKMKENFFSKIKILFSVTNCLKDIGWGLPGSSKTHQTFCKMVKALFTLKYQFYFPF